MAIRYEEIRPSLKCGDKVLFRGKGVFSWIIRTFTRSKGRPGKYTHIGTVIDPSEVAMRSLTKRKRSTIERTLLISESTMLSPLRDMETGKFVSGVQTSLLGQRLATYKGEVWIRRLNKPLTKPRLEAMMALRRKVHGRGYEKSPWALFRAAIDWPFSRQRRDLRTIFCSELTAAYDQAARLLPDDPSASEYTPVDYGEMWELLDGYSLGTPIPINLEGPA